MTTVSASDLSAIAKAFYGDAAAEIYKAEEKKRKPLSNTDKGLVAANALSAGIGVAAFNQLRKPASGNYTGNISTGRKGEAGGMFRQGARGAANSSAKAFRAAPQGSVQRKVLKPVVTGTRKTLRAADKTFGAGGGTKGRIARAAVAGGIIGGSAFNAAADAASAVSIANKNKVKKADTSVTRLKLRALDTAETQVRTKAPVAAKAVAAGAKTAKNTWKAEGKVSKALEDKRQVFGWASITEMDGVPVVDLQGDYVTIDEIEKAAYTYVSKSRKGGDMHRRNGADPHHVADMIESVVITPEKKEALGLPGDSPTGWWCGFQVHDDETWKMVKDGKRPMFSIHGSGRRVETEV